MEIIMAQDFQDLTGQAIMKMLGVVGVIESELVPVLLDCVPADKRSEETSLLNGPQITPTGRVDVVTSQDRVDALLSNLSIFRLSALAAPVPPDCRARQSVLEGQRVS